jgi:hypothetical protein
VPSRMGVLGYRRRQHWTRPALLLYLFAAALLLLLSVDHRAAAEAAAAAATAAADGAAAACDAPRPCGTDYTATLDGAGGDSLFLETPPWREHAFVSGVVSGGAAQQSGVVGGSTLLAVDGVEVTPRTAAAALQGVAGRPLQLRLGAPCARRMFEADAAPAAGTGTGERGKKRPPRGKRRGKKAKQAARERTLRLHAALAGFSDLGTARSIVREAARTAGGLPLSLERRVAARYTSQMGGQELPVLDFIMRTYNSLPLRFRPHEVRPLKKQRTYLPPGGQVAALSARSGHGGGGS